MARTTERLRLGPAALNPFTLHPYEIAGQIAMLDTVSGGRAYLGLVKGAWLDRLGIHEPRPLRALRESVAIIRALLAGDELGVAGERFTLAPGTTLAYPASARLCRSLSEHGGERRPRGQARSQTSSRSAEARTRTSFPSSANGSETRG